jgi:hypothetical protein
MRLYTRTGATALDDPEYGNFQADEEGGFDLPDDLSERLHRFHIDGRPAWETDVERQTRLIAEELDRRKDPATLLAAVQQLVAAAQSLPAQSAAPAPEPVPEVPAPITEPVPAPAPAAKRASKRAVAPAK